jgi:hypothetical protein
VDDYPASEVSLDEDVKTYAEPGEEVVELIELITKDLSDDFEPIHRESIPVKISAALDEYASEVGDEDCKVLAVWSCGSCYAENRKGYLIRLTCGVQCWWCE